MKIVAAFALVLLVTSVKAFAAGEDPAVAIALKKIEAAKANLTAAVARIERDPPANADLDAAAAAVEALKTALDSGVELEAKELDYARAVLAARKELRTQREYVDHRRATIQVHDMRRQIEPVVQTMNDRAKSATGKEPTAKDFEDGRAAIAVTKKLVGDARPLGKLDEKFAKYLTDLDAAIARHEQAIDDRWLQLSADKQRALLDGNRKALSSALAALAGGFNDALFKSADDAAGALSKRLEEGKPLEAKDKAYRADAEKARSELAQAKKKMGEAVTQAGLSRVQAELDPAYKDLSAAGKALRNKPTADQLAEARTAAIVVRKLMEKYEGQGAASKEIGEYLAKVKATLVETELVLQRRGLDAARKDLTASVRNLEKRGVTDEQFEEAKTALTVLEKTIETVHAKDPALSAHVYDAKAQLKEAKATIELRRFQVDLVRHRAKVDEAKKSAAALVTKIQTEKATDEQLAEAEAAVKQIETVLEEGAAFAKKDADYKQYAREAKDRATELKDRVSRRRIVLSAADAKAKLTEGVATAKARLETTKKPDSTDADVEAASKSVDAIMKFLEARAELEMQDAGYAAAAERVRSELGKLMETMDFAREARLLRRQSGEVLAAAVAATQSAEKSSDVRKSKELYESANAKLKACQDGAGKTIKGNPKLSTVEVLVEGQPTPARDVIALCAQKWEANQQPLNLTTALVRFEDGPKKAWEAAKYLSANSRKAEAEAQLDECIATGRIVENRFPELRERKFDVGGASMSLAELISNCNAQRKALKK